MKKLWNNKIIKNQYGQVRSGWILILVMGFFYLISYLSVELLVDILKNKLIASGDINVATDYFSDMANWVNDIALPIINQLITDAFMIAIAVFAWKFCMKQRMSGMGLSSVLRHKKEFGFGLLLGAVNFSIAFLIVITVGGGQVVSWVPQFSVVLFIWMAVFLLVGFAEEALNRGFLMGTLRRSRNIYVIMLIPSIIFGAIHLTNPNVTFLSVLNIILVGLLFSYMFIKSGNIWMSIGYHITWNIFQGCIYGIPVSGLDIPGMFTTQFTNNNILNGGMFGIEGGILTTAVTLLSFLVVWLYYRKSRYDFITDSIKVQQVQDTAQ